LAIVLVTVLAMASGHLLGGPEPATRTAVAVCSAARNPGLALLVATQNGAPPTVVATIFVYLIISALSSFHTSSTAARCCGRELPPAVGLEHDG
jgi:BASS family bile acid:Na+ symporter